MVSCLSNYKKCNKALNTKKNSNRYNKQSNDELIYH